MPFNGLMLGSDIGEVAKPLAMGTVGSLVAPKPVNSTSSEQAMTYLDWFKCTQSFLSFDISVRGTGYFMWKNGTLSWGRYTIQAKEEAERVQEFRNWVLSLIDGFAFEYYFVEDVIASCNFKTVRSLITLNSVLDGLILDGKVKPPTALFREGNSVWKKNLRGIAGSEFVVKGVDYTNGVDKECTKACLSALGLPPEMLKAGRYTDKQVEDICDAAGIALGTIAVKLMKTEVGRPKVTTTDIRKGYKIKQFTDAASALKSANRSAVSKGRDVIEIDLDAENATDLIRYMAKRIPEDPSAVYVVNAPVSKCCNLLLLKRLETSAERYYLVIMK